MLLLQRIYHQRGGPIMTQGVLPFQYEVEKKPGGLTALAGLPTYLEFGYVMGLNRAIEDRLKIRSGEQGWSDAETVMALILLNLADGQGLSDLDILDRSFRESAIQSCNAVEFWAKPLPAPCL